MRLVPSFALFHALSLTLRRGMAKVAYGGMSEALSIQVSVLSNLASATEAFLCPSNPPHALTGQWVEFVLTDLMMERMQTASDS